MDGSTSSESAPAVSPMSPPGSLDFYGKRTQMVKVQALEREIGQLQEDLKSVEGLQPASTYCKEVDDFVGAKPDPLVNITQKFRKSHPFWKHLRERDCISPSVCCCFRCTVNLKMLSFFTCCKSCKFKCLHCSCLGNATCLKCSNCNGHPACPTCSCCCFEQFFRNCKMVNSCCGCRKPVLAPVVNNHQY